MKGEVVRMLAPYHEDICVVVRVRERENTKETGNCNATEASEKRHRFQTGNWFRD
jgi:hypothetical protein